MFGEDDINYSLISAVREGNLERARELINSYGLSYSPEWSQGYVLLRNAVHFKHAGVAKLLLTSGSRVNSNSTEPSDTPLHFAARNGDIEIVKMLLDKGANIDAKNQYGKTPLHNALKNKAIEVIKLLLKHRADVNARDEYGKTPLHDAIKNEEINVINLLFGLRGDFNTKENDAKSPLHVEIKNKAIDCIELLLMHRADVNARDNDGLTPLHVAGKIGCLQIVEHLLNNGASVNCVCTSGGIKGYAPLHFAVAKGSEKLVTLLLSRGAHVDVKAEDGVTPLHMAAEKRSISIAEDLLNHGACIHSLTLREGYTPLHIATQRGRVTVVKLLLQHGAKVDNWDKDGKTVLHLAVETGNVMIVEDVLKYFPDLNDQSNRSSLKIAVHRYEEKYNKIVEALLKYGFSVSPEDANDPKLLHDAVEKGYFKIIEDLLKYGADVNTFNKFKEGVTPLHTAAKHKQEAVAKLLISYGADINARNKYQKTPIFYAIENADIKIFNLLLTNNANLKDSPELLNIGVQTRCMEIVTALLQCDVDVNASDENGRTALHYTALNKGFIRFTNNRNYIKIRGEIAKMLLSKGANVDAHTNDGETPLHCSAQTGAKEITIMLMDKGANVNAEQKDGTTALHIATQGGHKKVVNVLLEYGAKVDSKNENDVTPLHLAAENDYEEITETILKFGADINSRDKDGRTALHIASHGGHVKVISTLLEYGADINITRRNNCTPLDEAVDPFNYYDSDDDCFYVQDDDSYYDPDDDDYDLGVSICEETVQALEHHIVKMKAANLYVSEKNLQSVSWSSMRDFQNKCEEELASMKHENINNLNISFYDILAKDTRSLAVYMKNENIVQVLKAGDYKSKYPIYASMIENHFRMGMHRKELLEQVNIIFHSLFNTFPELPYDCTEKIFSYLSDKDLKNFN